MYLQYTLTYCIDNVFTIQFTADGEGVTEATDNTEVVEEEEEKGFFQDNKKVTFYIVLPLFVFCYGGSCVVYAIGKTYR